VQRFCKPKVGGSNPSPGIAGKLLIYYGYSRQWRVL
jgi:hypothetical protein